MEEEKEYELWQDGIPVAFADSLKEIMHYAAMYSQDGPVRIVEVSRDCKMIVASTASPHALKGYTE